MADNNSDMVDQCENMAVPTAVEYFNQLDTMSLILYCTSICTASCLAILYAVEVFFIFKYVSQKTQRSGKFIWMAGAQPVTAIAAVIGICVPRSMDITHMFILLYFARCLFMIIELVVDYFGGRVKMAHTLQGTRMRLNTLPICCCLLCLPMVEPTIGTIRRIEWMVYQASIVRPLTFLITGIILADYGILGEAIESRDPLFIVLDVVNIISTLLAVYGVIQFARISAEPLKRYHTSVLLRLTQMVLVIYNIQDAIFDMLVRRGVIGCDEYLPASTRASIWNSHLLIFECALLAVAAAFFLRPSTNATFDQHPAHNKNCHAVIKEITKHDTLVLAAGERPVSML